MDKNYILKIVRDQLANIKEPRWGIPDHINMKRSAQKWALQELMIRVKTAFNPYAEIDQFAAELYSFYKVRLNDEFRYAYEAIKDINDILNSMKGGKV